MLIYRFEDEYENGVYDGLYFEVGLVNEPHRHPDPRKDTKLDWDDCKSGHERFYFGFASVWSMRQWFRKSEREALAERGGVVKIYEVNDEYVRVGSRQATFIKDEATVVGHLDPIALK